MKTRILAAAVLLSAWWLGVYISGAENVLVRGGAALFNYAMSLGLVAFALVMFED